MSYHSDRPVRYSRRRPRSRNRALGCLVALIWVVLALVLGYQYFLRPRVSEMVGRAIGRQIGSGPPGTTGPAGQIQEGAARTLPTAVAALPEGEVRITEEQANAYIAANPEALAPLDSLRVRFTPGLVQAELRAFGQESTASAGVAVQAGRLIAVNPQLDGPLSALITLDDLLAPIQQQLNDELAASGRRVTDVRVEQGVLVLTVE
ncbi:MAG TPA: hypothetical protein VNL77_24740 [Roseiflexaceae bacterium]|nr:hypothetical protein [Roseiflexaceae bacterium]